MKRPTKGSEGWIQYSRFYISLLLSLTLPYIELKSTDAHTFAADNPGKLRTKPVDYNYLQFSIYELPKTFCDFYNLRIRRLFYTLIVFVGLLLLTIYMDCAERFKIHSHF